MIGALDRGAARHLRPARAASPRGVGCARRDQPPASSSRRSCCGSVRPLVTPGAVDASCRRTSTAAGPRRPAARARRADLYVRRAPASCAGCRFVAAARRCSTRSASLEVYVTWWLIQGAPPTLLTAFIFEGVNRRGAGALQVRAAAHRRRRGDDRHLHRHARVLAARWGRRWRSCGRSARSSGCSSGRRCCSADAQADLRRRASGTPACSPCAARRSGRPARRARARQGRARR